MSFTAPRMGYAIEARRFWNAIFEGNYRNNEGPNMRQGGHRGNWPCDFTACRLIWT
jgi:hypothetical protein